MFQRKIVELFQGLPNMFSIADNIFIAGFEDMHGDHYATVDKATQPKN